MKPGSVDALRAVSVARSTRLAKRSGATVKIWMEMIGAGFTAAG
jgi:hypothetical protein